MPRAVFADDLVELYAGDARRVVPLLERIPSTVVLDPPYDDVDLWRWSANVFTDQISARLVFTDPRMLGPVVDLFGPCAWIFTWDTGARPQLSLFGETS